jgi:hypothetical protein
MLYMDTSYCLTLEKKTEALTLYFPSPTLIRPHLGITSYCAFVVKSAKLRSGSVRSGSRSRRDQRSRVLVSRESGIHWSPGPFKGQVSRRKSVLF